MRMPIEKQRLHIVTGKGGVGKTTVAAALATLVARKGRRVLLVELGAEPKVHHALGGDPATYEIREFVPGIWVTYVTPPAAMREYGLMVLRSSRLYELLFENETVAKLVRMMPGMNELLYIGKIEYEERRLVRRGGDHYWDTIVVDAPATGHGVSLLKLPGVIEDAVSVGPLASNARRIRALLHDPRKTSVHLVCLPEETPVRETIELSRTLEDSLGVSRGYVFVNGVWPRGLDGPKRRCLKSLAHIIRSEHPDFTEILHIIKFFDTRRKLQERYITTLERSIDLPTAELPWIFGDGMSRASLAHLARHMKAGIERYTRV